MGVILKRVWKKRGRKKKIGMNEFIFGKYRNIIYYNVLLLELKN